MEMKDKYRVTKISSSGTRVSKMITDTQLQLFRAQRMKEMSKKGSNFLLKPMEEPKMDVFKKLMEESKKFGKQEKLKKSDLKKPIQDVRRESRT
jgi:hypothetical protein